MAYNINNSNLKQQDSQHNQVIATNRHFWGYVLSRDVWKVIKPIVYDFEKKYLMNSSYAKRSHFRIRWMFMRSWMSKHERAERPICEIWILSFSKSAKAC